jgi:probable H4MPT-linked C1 transfer pathway protein
MHAVSGGVIGWDIGGVNTKAARVARGEVLAVRASPFEVQRAPDLLVPLLRELVDALTGAGSQQPPAHAVTMTAELSQMFRTKRAGVSFVLDALESAFPSSLARVFAVDGRFLTPGQARLQPLGVAAANWSATAHLVSRHYPDALLVDVGTTTTDIIPIVGGTVASLGRTDPERLASGELVYTGALRTPVEAIARQVPLGAGMAGVSAEGFAIAGDVHLWRGSLASSDYTSATPDGRPATREFAGERLARVVCADRDMLDEADVSAIADAVARAQLSIITSAIERVVARHARLKIAVVTGLGAFLAEAAARGAGLQVIPLAEQLGDIGARCAPATAVALLFECAMGNGALEIRGAPTAHGCRPQAVADHTPLIDVVVKLGGGVLAHAEQFETAVGAIGAAARERRLLVVPGGGPFADAVRGVDRRIGVSDDAAHWMAVLAMDQYAHLVAWRLTDGVVIAQPSEIAGALRAGRVPVLAPFAWLRAADPLPHSWDVTSDSIAAWVAGAVGAPRLVLFKPPHAAGADLVDAQFHRTLPSQVALRIVSADQIEALRRSLVDGR